MSLNDYRPAPFWFLNHKLEKEEIIRQLCLMRDCGVSGFFLHPRAGLQTPYMYNYGQLQVVFADGSVGWYEAGWGPMVSETAHFIKDVFGPNGAVSFAKDKSSEHSDEVDSHVKAEKLLVHCAQTDADGKFVKADELLDMSDEPGHYDLCRFEQEYLLKAIRENIDLSQDLEDAVNSLRIVLAADKSFREKRAIDL